MKKWCLIGLFVGTFGFLIFPFVIYNGNQPMVVRTDSMLPTLKPNDLIIVKKTDISEIDVNDIIAFESHIEGIEIIAHRVSDIINQDGICCSQLSSQHPGAPSGLVTKIGRLGDENEKRNILALSPQYIDVYGKTLSPVHSNDSGV